MAFPRFSKDPNSVLDYTEDLSLWLDGDTISTSTWTVGAGLTYVTSTDTDTTATVWLSGGTLATEYTVSVRIVTAAGRTEDFSSTFSVVAH